MQGTRRVSGTMEGSAKTATRVEEVDRRRATWLAAAQAGDRNAYERSLNRLRRQDLSAQANGGAANRFRGDQRREGCAVERRRGQRADRPILPGSTVRRSRSPLSTSRPAGHYRRAFCRSRSRGEECCDRGDFSDWRVTAVHGGSLSGVSTQEANG
jgi:hypothetical protein